MNDKELQKQVRNALRSKQGDDVPGFAAMWVKAQRRQRASRSRYQKFAGVAAAAAIIAAVFLAWSPTEDNAPGIYLTEEDLMTSTQWLAPSDALLPEYRFDIYRDLPMLIETRDLDEGSLL